MIVEPFLVGLRAISQGPQGYRTCHFSRVCKYLFILEALKYVRFWWPPNLCLFLGAPKIFGASNLFLFFRGPQIRHFWGPQIVVHFQRPLKCVIFWASNLCLFLGAPKSWFIFRGPLKYVVLVAPKSLFIFRGP